MSRLNRHPRRTVRHVSRIRRREFAGIFCGVTRHEHLPDGRLLYTSFRHGNYSSKHCRIPIPVSSLRESMDRMNRPSPKRYLEQS